MVRSLLARGKIPKCFWPEAVNWSIHVLNRCPTFSVQNMTPEEAWSGCKPAVDHFKIFGCIAYAHVPNEKRKKLDDKGEKCSVSETSKAYKLFNPLTKKIVTSRDVIFMRTLGIGIDNSLLQSLLMKKMMKKGSNPYNHKFQQLMSLKIHKMKLQQPLKLHQQQQNPLIQQLNHVFIMFERGLDG